MICTCIKCDTEIDANQEHHRGRLCMDCEWKSENPSCTQEDYGKYEKFCMGVISQACMNLSNGIIEASDFERMRQKCKKNLDELKCRLEQKLPVDFVSQVEYMKGGVTC